MIGKKLMFRKITATFFQLYTWNGDSVSLSRFATSSKTCGVITEFLNEELPRRWRTTGKKWILFFGELRLLRPGISPWRLPPISCWISTVIVSSKPGNVDTTAYTNASRQCCIYLSFSLASLSIADRNLALQKKSGRHLFPSGLDFPAQ